MGVDAGVDDDEEDVDIKWKNANNGPKTTKTTNGFPADDTIVSKSISLFLLGRRKLVDSNQSWGWRC